MKKIIPIGILILLLLTISYFFINTPETLRSYNATNPQKYNTTPSPATTNLNLYTNQKYRFTIEYPKTGIDPNKNSLECGQTISESPAYFETTDGVIIDNLVLLEIIPDITIDEYIESQHISGPFEKVKILSSGADEAIALQPDVTHFSSLFRRDGKLFVVHDFDFTNEGCVNPNDNWKIEDHLRFY